jgi:exosome complex component RRP41
MSGSGSIRRTDLLALSNLRADGRKPHEIRRLRIQMGPLNNNNNSNGNNGMCCAGSALVEMGLTTVLATVRGPMECSRRADELPQQAIVQVQVKTAPFASSSLSTSQWTNPNTDRRLIEASHMIKRAMEATILLHLFPKCRIEITIVVLQEDGGRLCAAINAATLAIINAGIPIKDFCCACSAGHAATATSSRTTSTGGSSSSTTTTLIDLNRMEESSAGGQAAVHLPCAMLPQRGTIVLAQCEARLPDVETMQGVLEAAMMGCRAVFDVMQAAVRQDAARLLNARNGQAVVVDAFA